MFSSKGLQNNMPIFCCCCPYSVTGLRSYRKTKQSMRHVTVAYIALLARLSVHASQLFTNRRRVARG